MDALKQYEMQLDIIAPDRREWHLFNSLNFALALLTTIGHGNQLPETTAGQVLSKIILLFFPWFFLLVHGRYMAYFVGVGWWMGGWGGGWEDGGEGDSRGGGMGLLEN